MISEAVLPDLIWVPITRRVNGVSSRSARSEKFLRGPYSAVQVLAESYQDQAADRARRQSVRRRIGPDKTTG